MPKTLQEFKKFIKTYSTRRPTSEFLTTGVTIKKLPNAEVFEYEYRRLKEASKRPGGMTPAEKRDAQNLKAVLQVALNESILTQNQYNKLNTSFVNNIATSSPQRASRSAAVNSPRKGGTQTSVFTPGLRRALTTFDPPSSYVENARKNANGPFAAAIDALGRFGMPRFRRMQLIEIAGKNGHDHVFKQLSTPLRRRAWGMRGVASPSKGIKKTRR